MNPALPFVREAGHGPAVVCLHSNASNSGQWRDLMQVLAPSYRVLAPDAYGSGKSPDWPSNRTIALDDEVDFLAPVLQAAGDTFFVVGHSYGGAVALKLALRHPQRVRALVLYEPTLFSLIDAQSPAPNAADGIRHAVQSAGLALDAGDANAAARHFIDYWMGPASWDQTPEARKPPIAASVVNVRRWGHALFTEPAPLAAFAALDIPVLYLLGKNSPESAQGVARLLMAALPRVEVLELEGLGHMGPITHPARVNQAIAEYLERWV